ncbi:hypothetical protein K438DRAFT_1852846, partial [Mycena galopus ATCC 62051]
MCCCIVPIALISTWFSFPDADTDKYCSLNGAFAYIRFSPRFRVYAPCWIQSTLLTPITPRASQVKDENRRAEEIAYRPKLRAIPWPHGPEVQYLLWAAL